MNMNKEMVLKAEEAERIIYKYLPKEVGYQKTVLEAMNYSIKAGGKRLRPILMQETHKLFNGNSPVLESFIASIEMIHTYSLVHDDLPAMDNDMLRRGKPTTPAVYGEAMGILCGDALLNYAFEVALTSLEKANGNYERIGKALSLLASKAGVYGMIGGQVVDVESEKSLEVSKEKLDFIYEYKTGALIEASMMIGAILSKATDEDIELIGKVASKVGLAFQIQDDILDIEGNEATLGKPIGSDIKNNKATYVSFAGLDKSKAEVKRLTEEAIDLLDSLPYDNPFLKELLLYLIYRQN